MKLPKPKTRKKIKRNEFKKTAEKVRQSMVAEVKYLHKKKLHNRDDSDSPNIFNLY